MFRYPLVSMSLRVVGECMRSKKFVSYRDISEVLINVPNWVSAAAWIAYGVILCVACCGNLAMIVSCIWFIFSLISLPSSTTVRLEY